MVEKLKEKFSNQEFLEKLPLVGIGLIILFVIVSVVFSRVHISQSSKELAALQKEFEQLQADQKDETEKQESTVSALAGGKKVASYETAYSGNTGDILRAKKEYSESEAGVVIDELQQDNVSILESLSAYFEDDSYKDVWYPGHMSIQTPYWDFGTKYNVDAKSSEIPVVWVCYDTSIGGTVLGYTTAILNTESGKFRDAKPVVANVDGEYGDYAQMGGFSILGALQPSDGSVPEDAEPDDVTDDDIVVESTDDVDDSDDKVGTVVGDEEEQEVAE